MTAEQAIERSITHTEIVHLEHDSNVAEELAALSDDSVRAEGVTEYWGTEDGSEWRVHIADPTYYRIDDGEGNEIADGLDEHEVWRAARRASERIGDAVFVSGPGHDQTMVGGDY